MTQAEALAILKTGANVFLTGEPGSGKTHTINEYVRFLRSQGVQPSVTASTGIAATHIGGVTIHSWSGIGIKSKLTKRDLNFILDNKRVVSRIKKAKVLIIDEISMLSAETFTAVEQVCRAVRTSKLHNPTETPPPFGGLQVVLVGDFYQLPPVQKRPEPIAQPDFFNDFVEEEVPIFAFGSPAWQELDPMICYLLEQHRQEDQAFLDALNAIRRGEVGESARAVFTTRIVTTLPAETITKLFPHNANVDQINDRELGLLSTQTRSFPMKTRGAPPLIENLIRHCLSPEILVLKTGAKVMFTKNHPEGKYVNGTLGVVTGFDLETNQPIVQTRQGKTIIVEPTEWAIQDDSERILAAVSQFPLRLAWAITVHKSQGMSLDAAVMDLRQAFEYGQGYVALSRVRTLDGLYLLGFNERALEVHPIVATQDSRFRDASAVAELQLSKLAPAELEEKKATFLKRIGAGNADASGATVTEPTERIPSHRITFELLKTKKSLNDIAKERGTTVGTIIAHLEKLVAEKTINPAVDLAWLKPKPTHFKPIQAALETVLLKDGQMYLSQTRELLGPNYSFDEIRLVRLFL